MTGHGTLLRELDEDGLDGLAARVLASARPGDFAVLDADNTLWRHDLCEALLALLEAEGVLSVRRLDPALRAFEPAEDGSLYAHARTLPGRVGIDAAYRWMTRVFAHLPVDLLKEQVDRLMRRSGPVPYLVRVDGRSTVEHVDPPVIHPAQRRLVRSLREAGLGVHVVTGALGVVARMVLCDPRYGFALPLAAVHGARLAPVPGDTGNLTGTLAIREPVTWYAGKPAVVRARVDRVRRPLLVAGDSPSDWELLAHCDADRGVRLWVDRSERHTRALVEALDQGLFVPGAGDRTGMVAGWVRVTPEQLAS
ncbi:haloacid dehalogenase-like hydrolase [Streptomyces sp. NPDC056580]|uniref:haloacid dehalogenase-like hydrolase n=1 Tax=Streptomyces sp. NPDC056580 TaxID=3345872 RepID=UPI0036AAACE1